jgi:DNA-binding transcriptional LysR family regulator
LVAISHEAHVSPDFVEVASGGVERALLAVAAGAGIALLPESVAERFSPPGIRFVPLAASKPAIECAALTDPTVEHLGVHAFLRALTRVTAARPDDVAHHADAPAA